MAAALVLVLAAVPTASATEIGGEAAYLAAEGPVQRSGFWGSSPGISDRQVLSIGYTACGFYARGMSDEQVLREMVPWAEEIRGSRAYDVGLRGVRNANRYLCPQH